MKTTSQNKEADLHLITALDDEIDNHENFRTVAKPADDDKIVPADIDAVKIFNAMSRIEELREMTGTALLIEDGERYIKSLRETAERKMGKDVLAMIMESRFKLHLLLDSRGGIEGIGKRFKALSGKAVETIAYVTREASSLACDMMLNADRAYCLKDSHILWHLAVDDERLIQGESKKERRNRIAQNEKQDKTELQTFREMMGNRCKPGKKNRLMAKIDAARNHDRREVIFSGRELASYGIVDYAYDTTRQLVKRFCAESGVAGTTVQQAPAMGDFFNLAYSAEALSKAVGFNCGLRRDGQTGRFKLRIVDDKMDTRENREIAKLTGAILLNQLR